MSIIVTGASGQFGRAAAELLLARVAPADLILTSRTPDKLADLEKPGCPARGYTDQVPVRQGRTHGPGQEGRDE